MVSDIHDYAEFFMYRFNPKNELNGADHYFGTPLYTNINILIWNRWTYAMLIRCIGNDNQQLMEVFFDLKNISLIWNNIKLMIAKSFYLEDYSSYIKKIAIKIHSVAFTEERVYKKLQDIYEKKLNKIIYKYPKINGGFTGSIPIPIDKYFNNKGLSYSSTNVKADFTGGKEYLVFDRNELQKHNISAGDGIEFDNLSCLGQSIALNNLYVKYIIISGCCEWGDYQDIITVNNKKGKRMIGISISDLSNEAKFGEEILFGGKAYEYTENIVKIRQECVNIFQTKCNVFDEVDFFELPICPNMHIFSISIEV